MFTNPAPSLPPLHDAEALRAVARWLRRHADDADARAAILEQDRRRARTVTDTMRAIGAARAALPLASLTPGERRERRIAQRRERNREILKAAARGWTNAKIGERFNVHPATVSRIVAAAMRRGDPATTDYQPSPAPQL